MRPRTSLLAVSFLFCAACASTGAAPTESARRSAAAILAAEVGGGAHNAEAELYLRLAKEEFGYAQRMPNPSDNDRVDRLLRRAEVDAELSLALARNEEQKAILQTTIEEANKSSRRAKDTERRAKESDATAKESERRATESERMANQGERKAKN
jgi:hypothetical protein